jgi:hypothetical protein
MTDVDLYVDPCCPFAWAPAGLAAAATAVAGATT